MVSHRNYIQDMGNLMKLKTFRKVNEKSFAEYRIILGKHLRSIM